MTDQLKTYIGVIATVVLWGTSWLFSKIVLLEISPTNSAILRLIVASIIFYFMLRVFYKGHSIEKQDQLYTWGIGTFCIGIYFIVQYIGIKYTTTINSSIIIGLSPILTTLISAKIFHQEKLTYAKIFGALLGFLGIYLMFSKGEGLHFGQETLKGDLIMLASTLAWALFGVLSKRLVDKYEPFVAIAYAYIYGTVTLLPLTLVGGFWPSVMTMSIKGWGSLIYLASLCSVFGFYAWYQGIKILGASKTSMFSYVNPLVAVTIGFLFLKEPGDMYTLFGGLAIFGGVFIASLGKVKDRRDIRA